MADFGVARRLDSNGRMTAETGTYRWMAPEVIMHKQYDQTVDVYSFGIILYELLTSQLPYGNMPSLAAAAAVVDAGLRPGVPPDAPPAVAALMQRCWSAQPVDRPQFAAVLAELGATRQALEAASA